MPRPAAKKVTAAQKWAGNAKLAIGAGNALPPRPPAAARPPPPPRSASAATTMAAPVEGAGATAAASRGPQPANGLRNSGPAEGKSSDNEATDATAAAVNGKASQQKRKRATAAPKTAAAAPVAAVPKKRKSGNGKNSTKVSAPAGDAAGATAPSASTAGSADADASAAQRAAEASERTRRGDEELERQLQLAMEASKFESGRLHSSALTSTSLPEPQPDKQPSMHRKASAQMDRWRSLSTSQSLQQPAGWLAWTEAFCGTVSEGSWVPADPCTGCVDAAGRVEEAKRAGPVPAYIAAFLAGAAKDVTRRYGSSWMRCLRERDEKWWCDIMTPLRSRQVCLFLFKQCELVTMHASMCAGPAMCCGDLRPNRCQLRSMPCLPEFGPNDTRMQVTAMAAQLAQDRPAADGATPSTEFGTAETQEVVAAAAAPTAQPVVDLVDDNSNAAHERAAANAQAGGNATAVDAQRHATQSAVKEPVKPPQQRRNGESASSRTHRLAQLAESREEAELEQRALRERSQLPKTIDGFKKSTVYVLERHIARYQGLKPGTKRLGLHKGESYYDRSCVSDLHSACRWRREGRQVWVAVCRTACSFSVCNSY